ncbi:MAG: agmatine deiminase family protein [bacterium]|nr:agmatine deiminase family protein [bacterium]
MTQTPHQLGFRMPAEWEPHEATWLAWPHNAETWPGKIDKVPVVWAAMIKALAPHETVHVCVKDEAMARETQRVLSTGIPSSCVLDERSRGEDPSPPVEPRIIIHKIPTNDSWIRDFGPIFVKNHSEVAMTDWIFNTWGGRWEPRPLDNAVPKIISEKFGIQRFETGLVLEGGSIDVNGEGLMLTTESCLLSPTRNPDLSREQIEQKLNDFLGVKKVIWLQEGIAGDDTSGHIDDIARFVNPNTIVCILEKDRSHKNYKILKKNFELLEKATDLSGKPLNVIPLPMPQPIPGPKGEGYEDDCIPASYANFYIANKVVLLPVFGQKTDEEAMKILQNCFPNREVVGIPSSDLVWGLGGIHCVTQQQPCL